jgi:uncharacterized membrane protein
MEQYLNERFWEIDSIRGLAVVCMICYHFLFDLTFFGVLSFDVSSGIPWFFARITASTFIFLMGVSLTLSSSRSKLSGSYSHKSMFKKYLIRGFRIFLLGLFITLITWIFIPQEFIIFGILHFIGISIILAYPFLKRKYLNLIAGITIICIGIYLQTLNFDFSWLMWLGFVPNSLNTVDYFPIFPWFGIVLLGIFFGGVLYKNYKRQFTLPNLSNNYFFKGSAFLGKHSLVIYLIHQPIIILALYLLGVVNINYFF